MNVKGQIMMFPVHNALTDQICDINDLCAPELRSDPEKDEGKNKEIVEDIKAGNICRACYFCGV